jgi:hypothetical protein
MVSAPISTAILVRMATPLTAAIPATATTGAMRFWSASEVWSSGAGATVNLPSAPCVAHLSAGVADEWARRGEGIYLLTSQISCGGGGNVGIGRGGRLRSWSSQDGGAQRQLDKSGESELHGG